MGANLIPGQSLLSQMTYDDTSLMETSLTADQLVAKETVEQAVSQLIYKLERVQNSWEQKNTTLSHTVQFSEMEDAIKTVSFVLLERNQSRSIENFYLSN